MKSVVLAVWVSVVACGGSGDDLHAVVTCADYGQITQCESACEPRMGSGALGLGACSATDPQDGSQYACTDSGKVDGVRGCCMADGAGSATVVRFYECN